MDNQITIPINQTLIDKFEEEAIQELVNNTTVYVTQRIEEAKILESTRRKGVGTPLVRKIDVQQAFLFPQLLDKQVKGKPWWKKILHGLVPGLSFIPGFIYSHDTIWSDAVCMVIIVIVVLLTAYLIGD